MSQTGTAVIRGVETTRHVAQLELTKALEANASALGFSEVEQEQLRRITQTSCAGAPGSRAFRS